MEENFSQDLEHNRTLSTIDDEDLVTETDKQLKKNHQFHLGSPFEAFQRLFFGYHVKTKRTLSEEVESGDEESVGTWIKNDHVNPNDPDAYGYTPLLNAAVVGRLNAVNELIKNGADVNKSGPYGFTPLHASSQNGHSEIVSLLLKHGANINSRNDDMDTPMHLAIKSQQIEIVSMLLKHGADPKIQGFMGKDCVQCAVECGLLDVAQTLQKHNPSLDCNNNDNNDYNKK